VKATLPGGRGPACINKDKKQQPHICHMACICRCLQVANFRERRKAEVRLRRNLFPGSWVNKSRLQSTFRTMLLQPVQPYLEILFV
jgi:hypothetical protein